MTRKELPDDFKAHLDKIRVGNHMGDGGRQSLSCDLDQAPLLRSIFKRNRYKESRNDLNLWDAPLDCIPLESRPFNYLEIKTGKSLFADEAREIIAKGTIFAVFSFGSIHLDAKLLFRAAGILYVENASRQEIDNWYQTRTRWFSN